MNEPFILVHALRGFQATIAGKEGCYGCCTTVPRIAAYKGKTTGPETVLYHNPQRPASCDTGTTFPNNWRPNVQIHENVDIILLSNLFLPSPS